MNNNCVEFHTEPVEWGKTVNFTAVVEIGDNCCAC